MECTRHALHTPAFDSRRGHLIDGLLHDSEKLFRNPHRENLLEWYDWGHSPHLMGAVARSFSRSPRIVLPVVRQLTTFGSGRPASSAASLRGKYPTWWTVAVPFPLWRAAMTTIAFGSAGLSGSRWSQTTQAWREPGWLIIARMFCRAPMVTPATSAYRSPLEVVGAAIAIAPTSRVAGPSRPLP